MQLVINSLGGGHTHTHTRKHTHKHASKHTHTNTQANTHTHTDNLHRINFKKPGALAKGQRAPDLKTLKHKSGNK